MWHLCCSQSSKGTAKCMTVSPRHMPSALTEGNTEGELESPPGEVTMELTLLSG